MIRPKLSPSGRPRRPRRARIRGYPLAVWHWLTMTRQRTMRRFETGDGGMDIDDARRSRVWGESVGESLSARAGGGGGRVDFRMVAAAQPSSRALRE